MSNINKQLKKRRLELSLKQEDMQLRVGMSRQQYQQLESKGNPRLDTLKLVAKGLKMELMLIPQEKLRDVREFLDGKKSMVLKSHPATISLEKASPADNPWDGLLEDDES